MCATLIEGAIDYLATHLIFNKVPPNLEKLDNHTITKELNKIPGKSWNDYNTLFKWMFGKTLTEQLKAHDKNLIEPIQILFEFRNTLAHGNSLIMNLNIKKNAVTQLEFLGKYKTIYYYLKKNHLIRERQKNEEPPLFIDLFFNDESANHFFKKSYSFLMSIEHMFGQNNIPMALYRGCIQPMFDFDD